MLLSLMEVVYMRKFGLKVTSVLLLTAMMLSFSGCGKKTDRYYSKAKDYSHYIDLNKGWTRTKGSGKASRVYWERDHFGSWDMTGKFTYNTSQIVMTSGDYSGRKFPTKATVKMSNDEKTLTVFGEKYIR